MDIDDAKNFATTLKDIAMTLAIVAGGCWAVWKWRSTERLRKTKEMASPAGTLTAKHIKLNHNSALVTLEAVWRNCGPLAIQLECEPSQVYAYRVSTDQENGTLQLPKEPVAVQPVFKSWYVIEPNTDSVMHKHFVLPHPGVNLFKWVIGLHSKHATEYASDGIVICKRELVLDLSCEPQHNAG